MKRTKQLYYSNSVKMHMWMGLKATEVEVISWYTNVIYAFEMIF